MINEWVLATSNCPDRVGHAHDATAVSSPLFYRLATSVVNPCELKSRREIVGMLLEMI